ncbi:Phosphotransferase enzyme, partial [Ascosphaera atra]
LRPENIYLGEDGQISCITGWHNTCILPSLLVCGNPKIFCNPDPLPQTNLEEPELSSNYASLPEDEKQAAYTQWRDRLLFFNYAVHTALLCELQSEVMTTPFQPLIYHLTQTAGRPWTGDIVTLKGALMRIAQDWDNIIIRRNATKEGLPPRPFEEDKEDTQELYDMEARWWDCDHLVEDVWRKQIGIDEDGWVEASRYDEAVKVNERLKKEWIEHHLDHDVSEGKTQGYWPFDDHEEPG